MANTIKIRRGSGTPLASDFSDYELGYDYTGNKLYIKHNSSMVEVGDYLTTINNSNWSGTDLAIANGGTGGSTAAAARTNLGVDPAGTDNSTPVTIAAGKDYITISGQELTLGSVDVTTDITGALPITNGGTGATLASTARSNLGLAIGTNVQAYDDLLQDIANLSPTNSEDGYAVTYDDATGNLVLSAVASSGVTSVATGGGLTGGTITSTGTISHADTSSAANLTASSRTYVTALTFDTYGHVTGYSTGTETVTDTNTTYSAGTGLALSGTTFNADFSEFTDLTTAMANTDEFIILDAGVEKRKAANEIGLSIFSNDSGFTSNSGTVISVATGGGLSGGTITSSGTISHADTSSAANLTASGRTYVTGLTFDTYGHVTGYTTGTETVTDTNTTYTGTDGVTLVGTSFRADSTVLRTDTTFGGDVSGAYNSIVVADDSHNHVISNVDGLQTALDGKLSTSGTAANSQLLDSIDSTGFTRKGVESGTPNTASNRTTFTCEDAINTTSGNQSGLQVWQDTVNADAFMTFHVAGDYALYFGLDGGINDLAVGGWSMGANSYRIWHQGNDGANSGLDSDLLDGLHGSSYWTKSGSWAGDLTSNGWSRVQGVSSGGGEFVLAQKSAQMSTLIDGSYFAYEGGGFWSSSNSSYGNATGFQATGSDTITVKQADGGRGDIVVTGQVYGGFGALTTGGTADWNHSSNARAGNGYTLLLGNATNGHNFDTAYYHTLGFEYNSKDGSGNVTQLAMPYTGSTIAFRSRYNGTWGTWYKVLTTADEGSGNGIDADTLDGYHLSTTRNAANTVPVRDGNGYLNLGWINTTSGNTLTAATDYYVNTNDGYIRKKALANVREEIMGVGSGSSFLRSDANDTFTGTLTGSRIDLGYAHGAPNSIGCSNWFRSQGDTGWYNGSWGGGIYMIDSTWVRTYNSKSIYTAGTVAASGDVIAYYSDERLKTKIETIDNAVDKVMSLEGFIYEENELAEELGCKKKGKRQAGVSAQQVEKVLPEAVTLAPLDMETDKHSGEITSKSGENYLTVKYEKLVPLLIQAIKEQQQQINELKEQLNG